MSFFKQRSSFFRSSTALSLALLSAATLSLEAQAVETTSRLQGTVLTPAQSAIADATVTITHLPSGTKKVLTTDSNGHFSAAGLRVGGPYSVLVEAPSGNGREDNVFLTLGEASTVTITVEATPLEEIIVTAAAQSQQIKMGMATMIDEDRRKGIPATSRDLHDYVRIDPLVTVDPTNSNAISIAGSNNRFNSLTIDGVKQNDDFGLNNGGYPTQRSPIILDVIDQLSVNAAPFDVEYGGFQGGNINVVTKSGTNDYHGSAWFYYRDDSLTGSELDGEDQMLTFEEKVYGATFGGPIIEDKLFFMLGYEKLEATEPFDSGPEGAGFANSINNVSKADVDEIISIAQEVYDYDPGSYENARSLDETDEKVFGKIDWNLNDDHRLAFTYQRAEGNNINPQNTSASRGRYGLLSNWYNKTETMNSYALQVFSDWSENFSTEVRVSYKDVETRQESMTGNDFALMQISTPEGGDVYLGPDFYRHANDLENDTWQIKLAGTYYLDAHEISGGYEREMLDIFNLFVPGSKGSYVFDSIEDFRNRNAASLSYNNAFSNDANDGAAAFGYAIDTIYLQDRWDLNERLTMMFGLRYERYSTSDTPRLNQDFVDLHGFANNETIDGLDILMPRFGFNYMATERLTLRGGAGLFSGGNPNVWISNSYSNDGVTIVSYRDSDGVSNVDGFTLPQEALDAISSGDASGDVNYIDPGFEVPRAWKFNLAAEYTLDLGALGDGYHLTAEALLSRTDKGTKWVDICIEKSDTAPDGRPIYSSICNGGDQHIGLTNSEDGESTVFVVSLQKEYDNGLDFFFSYTNTDAKDVNPGTSSTASSNYAKLAFSDPNFPALATSNYEIKHKFIFNINYRTELVKDLESRFGLLFTSQSGRPFSYTFDGNSTFGNPDNYRDSQLFYVPVDENDVLLDGISWEELNVFIQESGLDKYRGRIAPRNAFNDPWVTTVDFRFSQELPGFSEGHRGVFTFDIQNLTNLLNNDWGRYDYTPFHYVQPVVSTVIDPATGKYVYSNLNSSAGEKTTDTLASLWKIRLGLRYEF
ncbi:TonB-dependent receptor [Luteithermobacter gelatinilyticus]|uniref:TonB-dependent receptor n=1 Tax=Luteithermobacter gelatinilyticus TaxID=2582913 RepID=UPI001106B30B|nr:TonB-dependent receptor [Luteithermobacter gelatinilyticus]